MYTNYLLDQKYKAQFKLWQKAKKLSKSYMNIVEEEVNQLFKEKGWQLKFSSKKGQWKKPTSNA